MLALLALAWFMSSVAAVWHGVGWFRFRNVDSKRARAHLSWTLGSFAASVLAFAGAVAWFAHDFSNAFGRAIGGIFR